MIFLLELPLLLLLLYPDAGDILVTGVVYIFGCAALYRKKEGIPENGWKNVRCLPLSVLVSGCLGAGFYVCWYRSGSAAEIASRLHMSKSVLLLLVAGTLSVLSVPGIHALFFGGCLAGKGGHTFPQPERKGSLPALQKKEYLICFLAALFTAMQFALRPFTDTNPGNDSSVFLYIGKRMHEGYVPYKDLFDHKGPVLYLIQYLGMFVRTDNCPGLGVWFWELFSMFFFVIVILKTTKLLTDSKTAQYMTLWILPAFCGRFVYEGGNFVEEYALPWIAVSFYIFLKYIVSGSFKKREILLLGLSFALVFFLRSNMIAVWAVFIPVVLFGMIYRKKWKELATCMGLFLAGCCAVVLPILAYCMYTDSLTDMIDCYFRFNMSYTGSSNSLFGQVGVMITLAACVRLAIPALVVGFMTAGKQKVFLFNCIFFLVSLVFSGISGRHYPHYGIVLLPAMTVFLVYLVQFTVQTLSSKYLVACLLLPAMYAIAHVPSAISFDRVQSDIAQYLLEHTDKSEDVLIIAGDTCDYLVTERTTANRFFYQIPPINISGELEEAFLEELAEHPSDTVLVSGAKADYIQEDSNLGEVCRYLEDCCENGMYTCEEYVDFFVYHFNFTQEK
jgi:hypothetical protein